MLAKLPGLLKCVKQFVLLPNALLLEFLCLEAVLFYSLFHFASIIR